MNMPENHRDHPRMFSNADIWPTIQMHTLSAPVARANLAWNPNGSGDWGDSARWPGGGTSGAGGTDVSIV